MAFKACGYLQGRGESEGKYIGEIDVDPRPIHGALGFDGASFVGAPQARGHADHRPARTLSSRQDTGKKKPRR
jgi:hypothetical protein